MSNNTTPIDTTTASIPPTTTPVSITTTPSASSPSSSTSSSSSSSESSDEPTTSLITSIITVSASSSDGTSVPPSTSTLVVTETQSQSESTSRTASTTTRTSTGTLASSTGGSGSGGGGLSSGGTIAIAVVVPIVGIALLVAAGLFLWRRRKQKHEAAEERRKEAEEYSYNPNNDPTLPAVAAAGATDGQYEMREDGTSGYRGWGNTAMGTAGRKTSTHVSGGLSNGTENGVGVAYSGETSPSHGPVSDRSNEPLVDGNRPISGEQEPLGAMGPSTSNNNPGVNRGVSNASSHYSNTNRSEGSGEGPPFNGNYYSTELPGETPYGSPPGRAEMGGQPVIRDVQARRNTRIESPSHFPQQSAGISQNF